MQLDAFMRGMDDPDLEYSEEERNEIIKHMLEDRSWKSHCTKTMEECAELQVELSKQIHAQGNIMHLLEEMADVYISLWLIQEVFTISQEEIDKAIDVKLKRNEFRYQAKKEKHEHELEGRVQ